MLEAMTRRLGRSANGLLAAALVAGTAGCQGVGGGGDEVRTIVRDAYIYGWPMYENYKTIHAYSLDPSSPEYKGPFNTLTNTARVYTPEDKTVVTPNSDTPYSFVAMDLRAEPLVFTVPPTGDRYFSIQLIDLYTHNFAYIGTRATGTEGGTYMVTGPDWSGDVPEGIDQVIPCETQLGLAIYRTQLYGPGDLDRVKALQNQYRAQTLSAYAGTEAPASPPEVDWPAPTQDAGMKPEVFTYINFLLQFCPMNPADQEKRDRFATIGIAPNGPFNPASLDNKAREAWEGGIADAWTEFDTLQAKINRGEVKTDRFFGTRSDLAGNDLYRFAGAKIGLYGNSEEEAMYPIYKVDGYGNPLDASKHDYTMIFPAGELPPAKAFWSLTMYDGKTQLLVQNPIDRYLINSPMLPDLVRNDDGSITLYIQHESPGKAKQANWLPAPNGPFYAVLRLYLPKESALDGSWTRPEMRPAS